MTLQTKSKSRAKPSELDGTDSHLSRNRGGEGGAPGVNVISYLKCETPAPLLVTFGGVYVMEWAGVLRFAQDDTANKNKIKSKTF